MLSEKENPHRLTLMNYADKRIIQGVIDSSENDGREIEVKVPTL